MGIVGRMPGVIEYRDIPVDIWEPYHMHMTCGEGSSNGTYFDVPWMEDDMREFETKKDLEIIDKFEGYLLDSRVEKGDDILIHISW